MQRKLIGPLAFLALMGAPLLAQNDECAQAIAIGVGSVAFDTTTATLSPEVWPCAANGGPDLWYTHTAGVTGNLTISTCGSGYDTALEVFTGACGALTSLACNDDVCGAQSSIQIAATMGTTYAIRVGGWNGSTGSGVLRVDDGSPQLNIGNGNYYLAVASLNVTWDQARADAAAMTFMGAPGHLATLTSQAENDFVYALGDVNNHWVGGFQNTASPSYSEPGGGWEWITGEPFVYSNWLPGEPNNTGAFGAEDYLELLQSAGFGETWNDAAQMEHPRGYVIEFPAGVLGTNYCTAVANSTGVAAVAGASGSSSVTQNDLTLSCREMPANAFGFFLTSPSQGFNPQPGGSQGVTPPIARG